MGYRSDIDGLRAIAILLVLFFHAGFALFPSGFIGVDIFFVISGFLITSIIRSAIQQNKFSLSQFYLRRLWRLQPALLTVLLFTLLLALFFYLPSDLLDYIKSAKYSSLFHSNHYFARATTGYAAPNTAYLLLLHTWSLSIEWQWYLVLPLTMVLLSRYFADNAIKIIALVIALGMLALSLYLSELFPEKSYYFFTARVFEFMLGSCLVLFGCERLKFGNYSAAVLGIVALIVIIYCASRKNILLGYPDYHALMVAVASATLITIGLSANVVSRLLSWRPLVFIGTISYSLYLWHWPIFATGRYLGIAESMIFTLGCLALTFVAAYLCYRLIEKPCRKITVSLKKSLLFLVILPLLLVLAVQYVVEKNGGFDKRFGDNLVQANQKIADFQSAQRAHCLDNQLADLAACQFGSQLPEAKTALMIGDSFANHLFAFTALLATDANISVRQFTTSACLMLPGIYLFDWWNFKHRIYQQCHQRTESAYQMISAGNYDYVIIGQAWPWYFDANIVTDPEKQRENATKQNLPAALRRAIDTILASGATPVLMRNTYFGDEKFRNCFYSNIKQRLKEVPHCLSTVAIKHDDTVESLFATLQKVYPTLIVIDPQQVQCPEGICHSTVNGVPVYRNGEHINDYASYQYGVQFLQHYSNPLKVAAER
ncbi:acyltransferase family protein [Serratia microhaemolytica]|uniref:acyltransferase family protein n=1 Tax=Serratia microhaemolytica TaxID=2675110 RepID=UPI000FDDD60B|nr:acyltransferase family protein [Serratia microhaemolytica]